MNTYPYLQDVQYVVAWQEELLGGLYRGGADQGREGRLPAARELARRWADQLGEGLARQAQLCLEAGPACEMHNYV